MTTRALDGTKIRDQGLAEPQDEIERLATESIRPALAAVLVGEILPPASMSNACGLCEVSERKTSHSHAALAGRPTKAQFVRVYGPKGPAMTWAQRAKAGVDAKHFQEALKGKS